MSNYRFWTEEEVKQLKEFYPYETKEQLEVRFTRSWKTIKDKASKIKISKRKGNEGLAILLNDSLQTMYWMGFLLADGHFTENRLSVELSYKDNNHLKAFTSYINTTNWYERTRILNNKEYRQCSTSINNITVIPKLIQKFDINNNKTINPPKVSTLLLTTEQLLSLFIGFIDGDGSIYIPTYTEKLRIECHKNWVDNLLFFEHLLYKAFTVTKLSEQLTKISSRDTAVLEISSATMLRKLKEFITDNKLSVMNRKWDLVK